MDLAEELEEYEGSFEQVVLADPLLTSDADFVAVAKAITEAMAGVRRRGNGVLLYGTRNRGRFQPGISQAPGNP